MRPCACRRCSIMNKTLLKLYRVHPLARNVPALLVDDSPFDGGDDAGDRHERRLVEDSAHRHRVNSGAARVFPTHQWLEQAASAGGGAPLPQGRSETTPEARGPKGDANNRE